MNAKHHRTPATPATTRARCPVCQEAVYSRAGIHPQCAVRQSEPPRPKAKPPGEVGVPAPTTDPADPAIVDDPDVAGPGPGG